MGVFAKGAVVVVQYPFSDLSGFKFRPALVLAEVSDGDYISCQITSKPYGSRTVIELNESENLHSGLRGTSFARPEKLFTAHESIIRALLWRLETNIVQQVVDAIVRILSSPNSTIASESD